MRVPSASLLRAMMHPPQPICHQIRCKSDWMPREKYAKISSLDKLHRKQKAEFREKRLAAELRAQNMTELPPSQKKAPPPSSTLNLDSLSSSESPSSHLPFLISRTPSNNLPIYETAKAGGSKHITCIRKITGDLSELASAVRMALGLQQYIVDPKGRKKETVSVNPVSRQVIIRGWRGSEVKKWAELSGF
ncbi:hypothetical protein PV10_00093 [Exophiala mesophila]|uniref:Large ribosomal subunit protein mL49 n=1 Tax=Exophiala mesophila TaxID=212818 RepID=A0A0D1ZNH7_EXOME|nr:uncharacterized protein PV10_00093 [Exophiala mesophila]KIV96197.1 hypothetical protein PV10_00093 [Exophiala mesophila]